VCDARAFDKIEDFSFDFNATLKYLMNQSKVLPEVIKTEAEDILNGVEVCLKVRM